MKLFDVNVLLYAANSAAPQHKLAYDALQSAYVEASVGMAWVAVLGFLRLATRAGILQRPLSVEQGLAVMQAWTEHPATVMLAPTARHGAVLGRLLIGAGRSGPLVSDAHLAALAIEHDAQLVTFDRDFERFAGLRCLVLS